MHIMFDFAARHRVQCWCGRLTGEIPNLGQKFDPILMLVRKAKGPCVTFAISPDFGADPWFFEGIRPDFD